MASAEDNFYNYLPPVPAALGDGAYDSVATATTADRTSLWANLGTPLGWVWLEFANIDATDSIYITLTTTDSGAGATTSSTGYKLTPGAHATFVVDPVKHVYVDWLASANTPRLKWRVASKLWNRLNQ